MLHAEVSDNIGDLLKLVTIIGIGKVMQRTPQIAHNDPISFPPGVLGATSP